MKKLFSNAAILSTLLLISTTSPLALAAEPLSDENFMGPKAACDFLPKAKLKIVHPRSGEAEYEPGETKTWEIKNVSLKGVRARDIDVTLDRSSQVEIITNECGFRNLPKGEKCRVVTQALDSAEPAEPFSITFAGCNTDPVEGTGKIVEKNILQIGSSDNFCLGINEPTDASGPIELLLTNIGNTDLTFSSSNVVFQGVNGVTLGQPTLAAGECSFSPSSGWTVSALRSCTIPVEVSEDAYNVVLGSNGTINITYMVGTDTDSASSCVNVPNTVVTINDNNPIELPVTSSTMKTYEVKNVGPFNWQNPYVIFATLSGLADITVNISEECSTLGSAAIPMGEGCDVQIIPGATSGEGTLSVTPGTPINQNFNVNANSVDVTVGEVSITLGKEQHLQYQQITITNLTSDNSDVFLRNVSWTLPELQNQIQVCQPGSLCDYFSTCIINTAIAPGEMCNLWIKSEGNHKNGKATEDDPFFKSGEVFVEVSNDNYTKHWNAEFNATKSVNFYAAGTFDAAGGNKANNIAQWNGIDWSPLGSLLENGLNSEGRGMTVYKGDLLVVGEFTNTAGVPFTNYVSVWNGSNWSPFDGTNVLDGFVNAVNLDRDVLTFGGKFTTVAGKDTPNAVTWTGSDWQPFGNKGGNGPDNEVKAIVSAYDGTYLGGDFRNVGISPTRPARHIAGWDPVALDWVTFGKFPRRNGTNRDVNDFYYVDNNLYAVGDFTKVYQDEFYRFDPALRVHHIARWDGSEWHREGNNQWRIDGDIHTITSYNNNIFIGGEFNNPETLLNAELDYVAFLDNNDRWKQAGVSIDGPVFDLYAHGLFLYAGGTFGNNILNNIGIWNGSNWDDVGNGVTNSDCPPEVKSLLVTHSLVLSNE